MEMITRRHLTDSENKELVHTQTFRVGTVGQQLRLTSAGVEIAFAAVSSWTEWV